MSDLPINSGRAKWIFCATLARGIVAAIFIYTGFEKLIDLARFGKDIRAYEAFPVGWTNVLAFTVPWIEIVAGAVLLFGLGRWRRDARLLVGIMLASFAALKISIELRGMKIDCGCAGHASFLEPVFRDWHGIIANFVLLGLLVVDAYCGRRAAGAVAAAADDDARLDAEPAT